MPAGPSHAKYRHAMVVVWHDPSFSWSCFCLLAGLVRGLKSLLALPVGSHVLWCAIYHPLPRHAPCDAGFYSRSRSFGQRYLRNRSALDPIGLHSARSMQVRVDMVVPGCLLTQRMHSRTTYPRGSGVRYCPARTAEITAAKSASVCLNFINLSSVFASHGRRISGRAGLRCL